MGLIQTLLNEGLGRYQDRRTDVAAARGQQAANATGRATDAATPTLASTSLSGQQPEAAPVRAEKQLRVTLQQAGADIAPETFAIQNLLRQKLSEHGIAASTPVALERDDTGRFSLQGALPDELKHSIAEEFNQSVELKEVFAKLKTHTPTFEYLRNNVRLQSAYGSENPVFSSLFSEQDAHNSLSDLTSRLDQMRQFKSESAPPILTTPDSGLVTERLASMAERLADGANSLAEGMHQELPRRFAVSINI